MENQKTNNKTLLNISLVIISQLASIVSGIILPKILLSYFGSETNGLVASITQFLSYISLIEGGLGSVYLASLYKPIVDGDNEKLSRVVAAGKKYFRIVSFVLIGYVIVLSVVYPLFVKTSFSYLFVFSLVYVLAVNLFIQYGFSISYKLLLQADKKAYIPLLVQTLITLANIGITILAVHLWPEIHFIKILSGALFLIQPVVFGIYVKKKYSLDYKIKCDAKKELPDRWSSFGQNVAFFVHQNTDITVLTIFKNVILVSVYSVHCMITAGLKAFAMAFSQVYSPRIGRAIAERDQTMIAEQVNDYEFISFFVCTVLFGTCATVITQFINLYTSNLSDSFLYRQPIFAVVLTLSEYLYCIRSPYAACVHGAGKFKETAISAYVEVGINVVLSLVLVWKFELLGVVIATCCAMVFRLVYLVVYSKKRIATSYNVFTTIKRLLISLGTMVIVFCGFTFLKPIVENYFHWILESVVCVFSIVLVSFLLSLLFDRKGLFRFLKKLFARKKGVGNEAAK